MQANSRWLALLAAFTLLVYAYMAATSFPQEELLDVERALHDVRLHDARWNEAVEGYRYSLLRDIGALERPQRDLDKARTALQTAAGQAGLDRPATRAVAALESGLQRKLDALRTLGRAYPALQRAATLWPETISSLQRSLAQPEQFQLRQQLQQISESVWLYLREPELGASALTELEAAVSQRSDVNLAILADNPSWPSVATIMEEIAMHGPYVREVLAEAHAVPVERLLGGVFAEIRRLQADYRWRSNVYNVVLWGLALGLLLYAIAAHLRLRRMARAFEQRAYQRTREAHDAEQRLRLMTDAMPASVSYIDRDERYRQTNATADAWYGEGRGASHGRRMSECLSPQAYAVSKPHIDRVLAGEPAHFVVDSPYPNGEERVVDVYYVPHRDQDGAVQGFYSMVVDITENRRTQQLLQQIIDTIPAGVSCIGLNGRFLLQNATGASWTGREPGAAVGQHVSEIWQASTHRACQPQLSRAMAGEEVEFDLPLYATDPTQPGRTLHVHFVPYRDGKQRVIGVLSLMTDVTEARMRQAQLSQMLDSLPAAIAYVDLLGCCRSVNAAWLAWFGDGSDPLGRELQAVQGEAVYAQQRAALRSALGGEASSLDIGLPANGARPARTLHTDYVPHLSESGRVRGVFTLMTDVTEVRKAQAALHESEERLRHVSESVNEFLWETDANARFTYVSERCRQVRGYSAEELLGQSPYDYILPEDRERVRAQIAAAIAARRPFDIERRIRCKSGEVIWERVTGIPRHADDGRYIGCRGAFEDVTKRKLVERQLQVMMDSVPAAIIYIDREQRFQQVNATWRGWFPQCGDPIGKRVPEFATAERYARMRPHIEGVLAGEPQSFDAPTLIAGEQRTLHVDYIPYSLEGQGVRGYFGLMTDVTEVRRSADKLVEQARMLERTEALARVGSWRWEVGDDHFSLSPETCNIIGLPARNEYPLAAIQSRYHRDDLPLARRCAEAGIKGGEDQSFELRLRREDGAWRTLFVQFEALREGGRTVALTGLLRDITEVKLAERLEARLRDIAAQVPGGIYQFALTATGAMELPYLSPGGAEIYGRTAEALMAEPQLMFDVLDPAEAPAIMRSVEASAQSLGRFHEEFRIRRHDGETRWIEVSSMPRRRDDGATLWTGYLQDISERKQLEHELAQLSQHLHEAIEALPGGFMLYDADDRLLYWNQEQQRIFQPDGLQYYRGMPFEELVRSGAARANGYGDFASDAAREAFVQQRLAQHRQPSSHHDLQLADGSWIAVRESRTAEGGVVGIRVDVTELKRAQEELREHRDNLQRLVDERTEELREALALAEQANRLKSEFLANMSHELRTPMHAILSFAGMGEGRADSAERDKLTRYFGRIAESGNRLLTLLNDLLDLSKLEAGHMELDFREEHFRALVHSVLEEFDALLQERKIEIRCHSSLRDTRLRCDGARILQVLRNLLSNAIKFSPDGAEIHLTLNTCPLDACDDDSLRFCIVDQGPGIPEDELESVFDKFVQSSKTRTGAGGTGLGLAICREIVHLHQGTITAGRTPAGGAVFTVCLPRDCERPRAPLPEEPCDGNCDRCTAPHPDAQG